MRLHVALEVAWAVEGGATLAALVPDEGVGAPLGVDQLVAREGTVPAKDRLAVRAHVGPPPGVTLDTTLTVTP